MSGHNPHGRLGPNSTWNSHLQVPSYIPRQPQLAHMSNERNIVRSPPTWHTPTPSEQALFSFMQAANHKNPLELKPLLPPFATPNPPPFGSVDLTISSARNSLSPLPRNLHSPGLGTSNISSPPPDFSIIKNSANSTTTSTSSIIRNSSPTPGVIQTTATIKEKLQTAGVNNGDLSAVVEGSGSIISTGTNSGTGIGGLFIRDANQINSDVDRMQQNREAIGITSMAEPVELVNSNIYSAKTQSITKSPTRLSPIQPSSPSTGILQSPLNLPNNIPATSKTQTDLSNAEPLQMEDVQPIRNASDTPSSPTPTDSPSSPTNLLIATPASLVAPSSSYSSPDSPPPQSNLTPPSPTNNSNISEDSVDSTNNKTRRKRKPNKTIRMSSDSLDNNLINNIELSSSQPHAEGNQTPEISTPQISDNHSQNIIDMIIPANGDNTLQDNKISENNIISPISQVVLPQPLPILPLQTSSDNDHDDVETIDKIAEMIAKTDNQNHDDIIMTTSNLELNCCTTETNDLEKTLNGTLTESKTNTNETSEVSSSIISEPTLPATTTTSHYEDVENKLEELFAGIEDDRPPIIINETNNSIIGTDDDKLELISSDNNISDKNIISNDIVSDINNVVNQTDEVIVEKKDPEPKTQSDNSNMNLTNNNSNNQTKSVNKPTIKRSKQLDSSQESNSNGGPSTKRKKKQNSNKKSINNKKSTSLNNLKAQQQKIPPTTSKEEVEKNYRGPYIQVKRNGEIIVLNGPISEDDPEKTQKVKKNIPGQTSSERNHIRGLHISTLSLKYDADTRDTSWICVFCKLGPHKNGLGDLFGPYILSTDCEEFQYSQIDPADDLFKSKRTKQDMIQKYVAGKKLLAAGGNLSELNTIKKKKKLEPTINETQTPQLIKAEEINIFAGMTKAGEKTYEVWVHEDCAVWAPGVHLIGVRILGLESAVWSCSRHKCTICSQYGAMICCLQRGCSDEVHIPCAKQNNWTLNDMDFKSRCDKHTLIS